MGCFLCSTRLPYALVVKWPKGNEVKTGSKIPAGSVIGKLTYHDVHSSPCIFNFVPICIMLVVYLSADNFLNLDIP